MLMKYIDENFMLKSDLARELYFNVAKDLPIIDYHCHIQPSLLCYNYKFRNITELWIADDHYKWTAMRWAGVKEKFITGDGTDYEKFKAYVSILPYCIGNPLHHWSHLELYNYFNYSEHLTDENANSAWEEINERISSGMTCLDLLGKSNVEAICTTDDPCDELAFHKSYKNGTCSKIKMFPAFRPDNTMDIKKADYFSYLDNLQRVSNVEIKGYDDLIIALENRIDYFDAQGCILADHGVEYLAYKNYSYEFQKNIFSRILDKREVSESDAAVFKSNMLFDLARLYHKKGWCMQIHFGVARNVNSSLFKRLGIDAGGDCIGGYSSLNGLISLLTDLESNECLPKLILYSINPNDNAAIDTIIGCFEDGDRGKGLLQHGSAWWFNDSRIGIESHLDTLASLSCLGSFIGMLTDSRSVLSYARHDYFRRILCNWISNLVLGGEYPHDMKYLTELIGNICYYNTRNYFGFK